MFFADLLGQVLERQDFPHGNSMNPKKRIVGLPKREPLPQSLSEKKAFPPQ
jgi:hypothetical protein